jgi:hypothetical protein
MRALRRGGIDTARALAGYVEAMLHERVLRKRWVGRTFLLWIEQSLRDGTLERGAPQPPGPGEQALDDLDDVLGDPPARPAPPDRRPRW